MKKKVLIANERFIERDSWYNRILKNSHNLTYKQIEQILDGYKHDWVDLTFRFYDDGSCDILDNNTEQYVNPRDLTGAAYDFYFRKQIARIKSKIKESIIKEREVVNVG